MVWAWCCSLFGIVAGSSKLPFCVGKKTPTMIKIVGLTPPSLGCACSWALNLHDRYHPPEDWCSQLLKIWEYLKYAVTFSGSGKMVFFMQLHLPYFSGIPSSMQLQFSKILDFILCSCRSEVFQNRCCISCPGVDILSSARNLSQHAHALWNCWPPIKRD